jgi:hypothetical protein
VSNCAIMFGYFFSLKRGLCQFQGAFVPSASVI